MRIRPKGVKRSLKIRVPRALPVGIYIPRHRVEASLNSPLVNDLNHTSWLDWIIHRHLCQGMCYSYRRLCQVIDKDGAIASQRLGSSKVHPGIEHLVDYLQNAYYKSRHILWHDSRLVNTPRLPTGHRIA